MFPSSAIWAIHLGQEEGWIKQQGPELATTQSFASSIHKRCSGISGKLKSNVDFHYKRCMENGLFQSVLLKEAAIELKEKLECVLKFYYLGDTLGGGRVGGGRVEETARVKVRCAWAKFKELSPILTARGATYSRVH